MVQIFRFEKESIFLSLSIQTMYITNTFNSKMVEIGSIRTPLTNGSWVDLSEIIVALESYWGPVVKTGFALRGTVNAFGILCAPRLPHDAPIASGRVVLLCGLCGALNAMLGIVSANTAFRIAEDGAGAEGSVVPEAWRTLARQVLHQIVGVKARIANVFWDAALTERWTFLEVEKNSYKEVEKIDKVGEW